MPTDLELKVLVSWFKNPENKEAIQHVFQVERWKDGKEIHKITDNYHYSYDGENGDLEQRPDGPERNNGTECYLELEGEHQIDKLGIPIEELESLLIGTCHRERITIWFTRADAIIIMKELKIPVIEREAKW